MGRSNLLIAAALLGATGLAVAGFTAAAIGDTQDLDAELGPAVVADTDAPEAAPRPPQSARPGPSPAVPGSAPSTSSASPDEPTKVSVPAPQRADEDEEGDDEPDEDEPDENEEDENDDHGDDE